MKWLSIKEFIPPTGADLLLRIERKSEYDYVYERYITASAECLYHDMDNPLHWELSNGAYYDIDLDEYTVTHFTIIDAVERVICEVKAAADKVMKKYAGAIEGLK